MLAQLLPRVPRAATVTVAGRTREPVQRPARGLTRSRGGGCAEHSAVPGTTGSLGRSARDAPSRDAPWCALHVAPHPQATHRVPPRQHSSRPHAPAAFSVDARRRASPSTAACSSSALALSTACDTRGRARRVRGGAAARPASGPSFWKRAATAWPQDVKPATAWPGFADSSVAPGARPRRPPPSDRRRR